MLALSLIHSFFNSSIHSGIEANVPESDCLSLYAISFCFLLLFFLVVPHDLLILVLQPGIKPVPPEVEAWSPNNWITSKFSLCNF